MGLPTEAHGQTKPPVLVTTKNAEVNGDDVTFFGHIQATRSLTSKAEVGFKYMADDGLWHRTYKKKVDPSLKAKFNISTELPFANYTYPYFAFARLPDSKYPMTEYAGQKRQVTVLSIAETVSIQTLNATATSSTTALVRGKITDFGTADAISVGAYYDSVGDDTPAHGSPAQTKTPDSDPIFTAEFTGLSSGTEYLGYAYGEVPDGPGGKRIKGRELKFTPQRASEHQTESAALQNIESDYESVTGHQADAGVRENGSAGIDYQTTATTSEGHADQIRIISKSYARQVKEGYPIGTLTAYAYHPAKLDYWIGRWYIAREWAEQFMAGEITEREYMEKVIYTLEPRY